MYLDLTQGNPDAHRDIRDPNEAENGLKNDTGTVAMARRPDPHSAGAQFFINAADNTYLDHRNDSPGGYGWAVFGRVEEGMEVVDAIAALRTGAYGDGFGSRPGGLSLAVLEANPHGVDLGPLEPALPGRLRTPSGKIELAPEPIAARFADLGCGDKGRWPRNALDLRRARR